MNEKGKRQEFSGDEPLPLSVREGNAEYWWKRAGELWEENARLEERAKIADEHIKQITERSLERKQEIARLRINAKCNCAPNGWTRECEPSCECRCHALEAENATLRGENHSLQTENSRLRGALLDAREKCQSARHVAASYVTADRTVGETNWRALRDRLGESIDHQNAVLFGEVKA